ncbi:transcription factor DUO1 isoform X2 [Nymphaea colorata]|uniref:transcription factor DUO1 isoform X2 n=1 Tax=Nymphaea colorata TaxID=210225 RepID=UPI00129D8BEF|nr:transcription factor DUO1 isoform X2 [Nymphaea colorata]
MRETGSSSSRSSHMSPKTTDSLPAMRKGPWLPEEDEILLEYVRQFGARDWSSIRSKGLLPRTGKSCRLRWVNKLKPDLKRCKFSPEEERIVIELQAKFGNKWARIATYLPGRTDNDVKNFWSTRQKRLARMLQAPAPGQASSSSSSAAPTSIMAPPTSAMAPTPTPTPTQAPALQYPPPKLVTMDARGIDPVARIRIFQEFSVFEAPLLNPLPFSGEPQCDQTSNCSTVLGNADVITMVRLPDMINENILNLDANSRPPQQLRCSNTKVEEEDHLTIGSHIPQPPLDVQFVPMMDDFAPGFYDDDFPADSIGQEDPLKLPLSLPTLDYDEEKVGTKQEDTDDPATPDSFFDDFPTDMFDCSEPVPTPTTLPDW